MDIDLATLPDAVSSQSLPWAPIRPGLSFKPVRFFPDLAGYALLLRVEPGTVIARHRHSGEVHAYHLSGQRKLLDTGELVGPGDYVYEPPGNVDSWMAVGDEPLVAFIVLWGAIEYLDEAGQVTQASSAATALDSYRRHCEASGVDVDALFAREPLRHAG
jgi:2,4'-dihydroxyacetophenone dioxygenase